MGTKISQFTELTRPDPEAFVILALDGENIKLPIRDLALISDFIADSGGGYRDDFWNINVSHYPWILQAIGAGTRAMQTTVANHPGILRFTQNGANTGYSFWSASASDILIEGEEDTELIFQMPTTTAVVIRFGFGDNFPAAAAPTDGIFINISATTLDGRCRNNGSETVTSTTLAIAATTWYRAKITVNAAKTQVTFTVYDSAGTVLWTDTVSSNIPSTTGRELAHGVQAYKTTAGTANLLDLDFISLQLLKVLSR